MSSARYFPTPGLNSYIIFRKIKTSDKFILPVNGPVSEVADNLHVIARLWHEFVRALLTDAWWENRLLGDGRRSRCTGDWY
jgi:hypothetical protein